MSKKIITSALPYPHGRLHLGRVVGAYLPADIYAKFCRAMWDDVIYISGTDDHGVGIEIEAEKTWLTYSEICSKYRDIYAQNFKSLWIEFDLFAGTDSIEHQIISNDFFDKIYTQWLLEEKTTEQMYCNICQKFLPDRYITWTCPKCKAEWQNGDQCEVCGSMLSPEELINPKCKTCWWSDLIRKSTKHLFFQLQKLQWDVANRLETKRWIWKNNVISTALDKWIKDDLHPRSYTRDVKCGIPVPLEGYKNKTIYVWFEAPLWYISITDIYLKQVGNRWTLADRRQNPETELIHFIGKDNTVFHSISRPSQIITYNKISDQKYILPTQIPANEFLNLEGKKFSTSRNYAVWTDDIVVKYNPDYVRFYLVSIMPENQDADRKWSEFADRCNNLCDSLGNLFSRVVNLVIKYREWLFQTANIDNVSQDIINLTNNFVSQIYICKENIIWHISNFQFRDGLAEMMHLFAIANKYINDTKPRELAKTDMTSTLYILDIMWWYLVTVAGIIYPYLPFTSQKILWYIYQGDEDIIINNYKNIWNNFDYDYRKMLTKPDYLFIKITPEQIAEEIEKLWL